MGRTDPAMDRIRKLRLFAACSDAELAAVAGRMVEHRARAGDVLARQGGLGRELITIFDGTATVLVDGNPIARLGPGEVVGEIALLDGGPRTATVVADTDLIAGVSTPREFAEILAAAPGVAARLLAVVATRVRVADLRRSG